MTKLSWQTAYAVYEAPQIAAALINIVDWHGRQPTLSYDKIL